MTEASPLYTMCLELFETFKRVDIFIIKNNLITGSNVLISDADFDALLKHINKKHLYQQLIPYAVNKDKFYLFKDVSLMDYTPYSLLSLVERLELKNKKTSSLQQKSSTYNSYARINITDSYIKSIIRGAKRIPTSEITDEMITEKRQIIIDNRNKKNDKTIIAICKIHGDLIKKDVRYCNNHKRYYCKNCKDSATAIWTFRNKEKDKEYQKNYRLNNKDKIKNRMRTKRLVNKLKRQGVSDDSIQSL